jgi:hypothetical protein
LISSILYFKPVWAKHPVQPLLLLFSTLVALDRLVALGIQQRCSRRALQLKSSLREPILPFGVDLLILQFGGNARKTKEGYTKRNLNGLVDALLTAVQSSLFQLWESHKNQLSINCMLFEYCT